jgi:hypothetical protein
MNIAVETVQPGTAMPYPGLLRPLSLEDHVIVNAARKALSSPGIHVSVSFMSIYIYLIPTSITIELPIVAGTVYELLGYF